MSRQQLKRWVAPLWVSLSQAMSGPALGLGIQAHLPAHRPPSLQPGVQA